ncbi:MAG TPA: sigma-70 family RNA polymerase sigma factor [Bacteroidia bacterium]
MTEKELIQGCKKQDRRCQNALYRLYFPLLSSIALRYSDNEEEAVQHINYGFLKVLQNIESYNPEYTLATWIRNILINHIIDENRKKRLYVSNIEVVEDIEAEDLYNYNDGEQRMQADDLLAMLRKLPDSSRKVFTLFAIDGFRHKEIAEMLDISEGTSKWHVNDARRKLMELLQNEKKTINESRLTS